MSVIQYNMIILIVKPGEYQGLFKVKFEAVLDQNIRITKESTTYLESKQTLLSQLLFLCTYEPN